MTKISSININGVKYDIVDKATSEAIAKLNEPYLPYPTIKREVIESQNISDTISDGFEIKDYPYFYFTSTNEGRLLFTKLGNTYHLNFVYLTSYLSNYIDNIDEGEVITIHYGN